MTKQYTKSMIHRAKYNNKMKTRLSKCLKDFFKDDLKDEIYMKWLSKCG